MTTRCESTAIAQRGDGSKQPVQCWLLTSQHERDMDRKHWAVVDGKPYEWGGKR